MSFVGRFVFFIQRMYTRVHWVCPLLGGLSSFGVSIQSVYTRVHWVCPLLGGLSSFGVSIQSVYTRVHWVCPLLGGLSSLFRECILEYIGCVLYWEVCPLSKCPLSEVSLYCRGGGGGCGLYIVHTI